MEGIIADLETQLTKLDIVVPKQHDAPQRPSGPPQKGGPPTTKPTTAQVAERFAQISAILTAQPLLAIALGYSSQVECLEAFTNSRLINQYSQRTALNLRFLLTEAKFTVPNGLAFLNADLRDLAHMCPVFVEKQAALPCCPSPLGPTRCRWARAPQLCWFFWHFGPCPSYHTCGELEPSGVPCTAKLHLRPAIEAHVDLHKGLIPFEHLPLLIAVKKGSPPTPSKAPYPSDTDRNLAAAIAVHLDQLKHQHLQEVAILNRRRSAVTAASNGGNERQARNILDKEVDRSGFLAGSQSRKRERE